MYGAESRNRLKQRRPAYAGCSAVCCRHRGRQENQEAAYRSLRQRVNELETFELERKAIVSELKGTRQRLPYLLAVSPAIISDQGDRRLCVHLRQ
jgi:hypothetical protein